MIFDDFVKILNTIHSSKTADHTIVCDKLCNLFEKKWSSNALHIKYKYELELHLKRKKQDIWQVVKN